MKAGTQTPYHRSGCGPESLTPVGEKGSGPCPRGASRIGSLRAAVPCSWPVGSWRQRLHPHPNIRAPDIVRAKPAASRLGCVKIDVMVKSNNETANDGDQGGSIANGRAITAAQHGVRS